ncbi:MAG: hypothetical protein ACTHKA_29065 [Anaerocolumna jejuensis]
MKEHDYMATSFSQSIETSHERREEQLKAECSKEGIEFINIQNISLREVGSSKAALGSALTSLVGGNAAYDFLQIYTLRQGSQVQYYYQPFSGITPLPGQHFKVIPVSLKNPIQYRIKKKQTFTESLYQTFINRIPFFIGKKIRVCEWLCVDKAEQIKLKSLKLPFLREISHVWQNGLTKIELDWTFQANAIAEGYSLVSMQTGRYGALGERAGLKQFKDICTFISQHGEHYSGDSSNNVMISNTYLGYLFKNKFLSDEQENKDTGVPVWKPQNVVKSIITNLIQFKNHKKVYLVQNIDEKKMKNLKVCSLDKNNIDKSEVIAAAAMDTFGNMKNAAVFTKDKLYISDLNYELSLNLSEIQANKGLKGLTDSSLELVLSNGEVSKIEVTLIGEFMNDFMNEICNIN